MLVGTAFTTSREGATSLTGESIRKSTGQAKPVFPSAAAHAFSLHVESSQGLLHGTGLQWSGALSGTRWLSTTQGGWAESRRTGDSALFSNPAFSAVTLTLSPICSCIYFSVGADPGGE